MSGSPVRLFAAAMIMAAASAATITAASASCYSCGPAVYAPPPVVYYAAPAPSCGCAIQSPMYVVNQGPTYAAPVTIEAEPTPAYEPGYRRAYPYIGDRGVGWHRRHWQRPHSYGHRHHGRRYGALVPGYRFGMRSRHPMIGPRGIYRGSRFAHGPRVRFDMPRMHLRTPGVVHPRMMGPGPKGPQGPMKKPGQP